MIITLQIKYRYFHLLPFYFLLVNKAISKKLSNRERPVSFILYIYYQNYILDYII